MPKIAWLIIGSSLGALLSFSPASASHFQAHKDLVTLAQTEPLEADAYVAARRVEVLSRIGGDLFAAGREVLVQGTVEQDLFVAAMGVTVTGQVGGDLRVAAGDVFISGRVGESALIASRGLRLEESSVVAQDLYAAADRIHAAGVLAGRIVLVADEIRLNGPVNGQLRLRARKIRLGPKASIVGNLRYESPQEIQIDAGARLTGTTEWIKTTAEAARTFNAKRWRSVLGVLARFFFFLVLLGLGTLLVWGVPSGFYRYALTLRAQPLWSAVLGLVLLGVTPVLALLLVLSVFGLPLALVLLLLFGLALVWGYLGSAYMLGLLILPPKSVPGRLGSFFTGFVLLSFAGFIPFVGWLATASALCVGLGGLWLVKREPEPAPAAPLPLTPSAPEPVRASVAPRLPAAQVPEVKTHPRRTVRRVRKPPRRAPGRAKNKTLEGISSGGRRRQTGRKNRPQNSGIAS